VRLFRIYSYDEAVSVRVAHGLLPMMQKVLKTWLAPADIILDPSGLACPHESVLRWSWSTGGDAVVRLHRAGINVLVLSEAFEQWGLLNVGESLALHSMLQKHCFTVIIAAGYDYGYGPFTARRTWCDLPPEEAVSGICRSGENKCSLFEPSPAIHVDRRIKDYWQVDVRRYRFMGPPTDTSKVFLAFGWQ